MVSEDQRQEDSVSGHFNKSKVLQFGASQPELASSNSWLGLDTSVAAEDSHAVSRKRRELMALAFACATFCPHCIELRLKGARAAGASQKEINEASLFAAVLRAETPDTMALNL